FGPKTAEVDAELVARNLEKGGVAYLRVNVLLPINHYIYSMDEGFSGRTEITLGQIEGLEPIDGAFTPSKKPKVVMEELLGQEVEKFFNEVTWTQRFRIVDARTAAIKGELTGQFCTAGKDGQGGNCTPIRPPAQFEGKLQVDPTLPEETAPEVPEFSFNQVVQPTRGKQDKPDPLTLAFSLTPEQAKVGDEVRIQIQMNLDEGWHAYGQDQNPAHSGLPTQLKVLEVYGLEPIDDRFTPDHAPEELDPLGEGKTQLQFHGTINWFRRFRVTDASFAAKGSINYQVCKTACLPPKTVEFTLGNPALAMVKLDGAETALADADDVGGDADEEMAAGSVGQFLLFAFLGGLILNVMPCVLPVLAIKVLSFAKQAGESRARVVVLNFAYSAGVILVFLILAALAVGISVGGDKLGWGQLFQKSEFNLIMAAVLFAMGLSLLGVFEIPIPGMGGGDSKEGPLGAFLTGILATLLATPCSGPFMGVTLAWSVKQPPSVTFLVWGVMGLGMASPYILFALVPGAVKLLPKPGMWMVRFKEFAGFVLLATVIYFITFLEERFIIPLLIALLTIGLATWMIGTLYQHNSSKSQKLKVRLSALAFCVLGFFAAYKFTEPQSATSSGGELAIPDDGKTLPWQSFSEKRLMSLLGEKKTVMIDFTADWCLICKQNEKFALNTADTLKVVKDNDIVPLYADYTHANAEIKKWLDKFESISVPLTVIFPNGETKNPIVLRDAYTKGRLLKTLKEVVSGGKVAQAN
ncbi:MAG: protein-disulfide reductase DsbD family protein, partial [Planctomycetaceae bacterium]